MSKPQKIITIVLWFAAVAGMLGVLAMKAGRLGIAAMNTLPPTAPVLAKPAAQPVDDPLEAAPPVMYSVPSFKLVDQDAQPASSDDLLGHPWVADFIFTTCASLCPAMSAHMSELQSQLPADVKLVSFSVDPLHDNPAALKQYGDRYHAIPGRWIFLTGDEKTQEQVIRGMKLGFVPAQDGNPIAHDEHFVLVDAKGRIRGFYDSYVPERLEQLVRDARALAQDGGK
jgi:protein SCO1/2